MVAGNTTVKLAINLQAPVPAPHVTLFDGEADPEVPRDRDALRAPSEPKIVDVGEADDAKLLAPSSQNSAAKKRSSYAAQLADPSLQKAKHGRIAHPMDVDMHFTATAHSLSSLPPEVLCDIVSKLSGGDVQLLWNCGNKKLNETLGARGGARKLDFEIDCMPTFKWPSFIQNLTRLSEFRISEAWLASAGSGLRHLPFEAPLTLRTLVLKFADAPALFLQSLARTPSVYLTLETLDVEGEHEELEKEEAEALKSLSSLTSLRFRWMQYAGCLSDLIPPNLTDLDLHINNVTLDLGSLPQSLRSFKVDGFETFVDGVPPPGLTKFSFTNEDAKVFTVEEVQALPRALTHLEIAMDWNNKHIWTALPPGLRTLDVSNTDFLPTDEHIKLSPRTLTEFHLNRTITLDNIDLLPPALTALNIAADARIFPKLHASLRELIFGDGWLTSTSTDLTALPKQLSSLTLTSKVLELSHCNFPATLTYFTAFGMRFTSDHARLLPLGLTSLHFSQFDPECLALLPRGLIQLRSSPLGRDEPRALITTELASKLPSTLRSLHLHSIYVESTETILALPQSIISLNLRIGSLGKSCDRLKTLTSLQMLQLDIETYQDGLGHAILSSLPRRLASCTLTIHGAAVTDIGEETLQQLPPSLTSLYIPNSNAILSIKHRPCYLCPYLKVHCDHIPLWEEGRLLQNFNVPPTTSR